jgi:hypothetical protein
MISQTEICLKTEDGELIEAVFVESVIDITTHRSSKRELDRKCYLREKRSVNRSRVIEHVGGNKFLIDGKIRATAFPCVE